jgi:hypothetical protein
MLQYVDFRSKPGFTSSPSRMSMFGITSFMFALGIITLTLNTTLNIRDANLNTGSSTAVTTYYHAYYYIFDATSLLMVRLCDAFLSSA